MALNFLNNGYFAGKVGIGTESPNYKLAVYGSSADSEIVASFGSGNDQNEYTAIGLSGFIASNGATKAGIALKRTGVYGTGELHFLNNNTLNNSDMTLSDSKMMINASGNVGIGTTSPSTRLEVAASATTSVDIAHFSNSNDVVKIKHALDGLGSGITSIFDASNNEDIRLSAQSNSWFNAGNVGIGTTGPTTKLNVSGNISVSSGSYLSFIDSNLNYNKIGRNTSVGGIQITTGASATMNLLDNGNVGIGTTGPLEPLSVFAGTNESVYDVLGVYNSITGTSAVGKGAAIRIGRNVDGNYSTKIATIYEDNNPSFLQPAMAFFTMRSTYLKGSEVERMRITSAGGISFGSTGTAYGTSGQILKSNGNASPTWIDGSAIPGVPAGSGTVNYLARWTPDVNTLATGVTYDNGTNVGILTTNPLDRLQVSGVISATANDSAYSNGYFAKLSSDYGPNALKLTSRTGDILRASDYGSTVSILTGNPTSVKMFIASGGNVGIGTTGPSARLEVSDNNTTKTAIHIDNTSTGGHRWDIASIGSAVSGRVGNLQIRNDSDALNIVEITGAGNVGIGTTNPIDKLSVRGSAGANSISVLDPTLDLRRASMGLDSLENGFIELRRDNNTVYTYISSSGNSYFNGGNVGIGTTTPQQKLDVVGRVRASYNTSNYYEIGASSAGGFVVGKSGGVETVNIRTYGDSHFNGGNFGIGTASPNEKLDVAGNIKIQAALLSNQDNTDVDTGTETVANVAIATYTAAFFDFVIKKGTNVRSGTVYACHDDTTVQFTETSTQDLGDTSDVTLSVDISGGNMRLLATVTSDDWSVKSLIRAI